MEEIPDTGRRVKCSQCGHVWFCGAAPVNAQWEDSPETGWVTPEGLAPAGIGASADGSLPSLGPGEMMDGGGGEEDTGYLDEPDVAPDGDGLTLMLWLIGILAVLVVILGVHVFAPQISELIPGISPFLAVYVEIVGDVLAWFAETAAVVGVGLREAFQSYGS